jgi:hypothetical protein
LYRDLESALKKSSLFFSPPKLSKEPKQPPPQAYRASREPKRAWFRY